MGRAFPRRENPRPWLSASIAFGLALMAACGDTVEGTAGATAAGGASASSSGGDGGGGNTTNGMTPSECLGDHHFPVAPDYDQFAPVMGNHCKGTNHQDITGVEKVVFVGDSITEGTFPSTAAQFYRTVLGDKLAAKFPGVEIMECAQNGARMDDLAGQLGQCFPDVEPKTSLVIMTMGGNDIANWASSGYSQDEALADADVIAGQLRDAVATLQDPAKFPAGAFFVFANVYEYTDGTADLDSCPTAGLVGLGGDYYEGAVALARLEELYMQVAVDTQTDMILLGEEFCGHGYNRGVMNTCFISADAENWFDLTCIHPTPTGHQRIAELFELVVDE